MALVLIIRRCLRKKHSSLYSLKKLKSFWYLTIVINTFIGQADIWHTVERMSESPYLAVYASLKALWFIWKGPSRFGPRSDSIWPQGTYLHWPVLFKSIKKYMTMYLISSLLVTYHSGGECYSGGEALCMWGHRVHGKYVPFSFTVNLKFSKKIVFLKNRTDTWSLRILLFLNFFAFSDHYLELPFSGMVGASLCLNSGLFLPSPAITVLSGFWGCKF